MRPHAPRDRRRPRIAELRWQTIIPRPLDEAFAFFADARNLNRITPAWIGFEILTPGEIHMREGALIDYRIRIRGIPVRWRTQIILWEPPYRFIDLQLRGPYRWWRHEHRFESCDGGTRIIDHVQYRAPLHRLIHPLLVRRDVERIFSYRAHALQDALAVR